MTIPSFDVSLSAIHGAAVAGARWRGVSIYTSRSQISWVGTSSASSFMYVYVTDDGNLMTNVVSGRSQANVTTMTDNDEDKK